MSVPQQHGGAGGATLQVYRKPTFSASAVIFTVKLDGAEVGKVNPNETFRMQLAPGAHRLQVVTWARQGSKTVNFTARPGETVYFTATALVMAVLHPLELVQDDGGPAAAAASGERAPSAFQQFASQFAPRQNQPNTSPTQQPPPTHQTPPAQQNWPPQSPQQQYVPPPHAQAQAQPQPHAQQQPEPSIGGVRETDTYEEPLGDEVRIIDNRHSATGITRSVKASREWSRNLTVGKDSKRTFGAEVGGGPAWLRAKGSIEAELQRTYSMEQGSRHVFEEEITVSVPARTTVRLELRWKRIWQRGFVELAQADGTVTQVPYQVVVNVTFDQTLRDTDSEPWTAAPGAPSGPAEVPTQMITVKPEE